MPTVQLIDESTTGDRIQGSHLDLESEELTVGDLIALRVRAEVRDYNNRQPGGYYGLVQPSDLENMLNGPKARRFKPIDADSQVAVALRAFRDQRVILLLPEGQATSLDQEIRLNDGDEVSFLRLVPLIGG